MTLTCTETHQPGRLPHNRDMDKRSIPIMEYSYILTLKMILKHTLMVISTLLEPVQGESNDICLPAFGLLVRPYVYLTVLVQ
jgi:hypothetical protein